jgi:tRNA(Arg) A34 adenosine deaminase TadA
MTLSSPLDKRRFLALSLDEAIRGARAGLGGPFGAVVVKGELVLAAACNRVVANNDPTAHAEVEALRLAGRALGSFRLDGCDVYASCEPCPMCLFALCWARPRAVYYAAGRADAAAAGFDDAVLYGACNLAPANLPILVEQVAVPDATLPFAVYAALVNKIPY